MRILGSPVRVVRFLGRGTAAWLLAGATGAVMLGVVELGIAFFLQLFLQSLGLLGDLATPGPLRDLALAPRSVLLVLVGIGVLRALGQFVVAHSSNESMDRINARLRKIATYDLLYDPLRRLPSAARVHGQLSETFPKASQFCFHTTSLVSQLLQVALLVTWLVWSAPAEACAGLAGLGIVAVIVLRVGRHVRALGAQVPIEHVVLTEGVERVARNILLVRVLRTQAREHDRFLASIDRYMRHSLRAARLGNTAMAMTPFLGLVLLALIVFVSQALGATSSLTLVSFLYLFVRLVQGLATTAAIWSAMNTVATQFASALAYFESIPVALRAEALSNGRPTRVAFPGPADAAAPRIEVRNVAFSYPGRNEPILADLSFEVPAGTQLAIVGPSGCGKSTLLSLVLGVLSPTAGEIRVGGQEAREFFERSDSRVGYVGAEPFLIAGTIRENLHYGLAAVKSDQECWSALEQARLRDVVEKLPSGLEHPIPEDGSGLSAGQKQRLCLARALLARPQVLVLDEVSANLDEATEMEVAESLRELRGRCTTVIVSHRHGILRWADRSVDLGTGHFDRPVAAS